MATDQPSSAANANVNANLNAIPYLECPLVSRWGIALYERAPHLRISMAANTSILYSAPYVVDSQAFVLPIVTFAFPAPVSSVPQS